MIIIHKHLHNLVAGYDRICQLDRTLRGKWRHDLLIAYGRKRQDHARVLAELRQHQVQVNQNRWFALALIGIVILLCSALNFFAPLVVRNFNWTSACLLQLQLSCLAGIAAFLLILYEVTQGRRKAPPVPEHPLKSNLVASLLPEWRHGLRGDVPTDQPTTGASGENDFVAYLQYLDDSYFVTYRLVQNHKGEVDVILIGPKGIWLFEVKDWKGQIIYRNGIWKRAAPNYPEDGSYQEPQPISPPYPHDQWAWVCRDVKETLRRKAADLVFDAPKLFNLQGGVVFTHPKAEFDIGPDCPVIWGTMGFWKQTLDAAPIIPEINERICLQVLDVLLARHREIMAESTSVCMDGYAQGLAREAESRLAAWVRA